MKCPFCGSSKIKLGRIKTDYLENPETGERTTWYKAGLVKAYNYSYRCGSCKARGGIGHSEAEALEKFTLRSETDLEHFKRMLKSVEFGGSTQSEERDLNWNGELIPVIVISCYTSELGDKFEVYFHAGTEDLLGFC